MRWTRVNRKHPCAICAKPDWCGYSDEVSICMRIESAHATQNGGWLHGDTRLHSHVSSPPIPRTPLPNPLALWKGWQHDTDPCHLDGFAMTLGVDTDALRATGCAWARNAWAFPMRNHYGNVIGIRLRSDDGRKWAIKGSQQGLFIPTEYPYCVDDGTMYVVEGPTDLAAAMTIGLYSIGRPSCLGQENMIAEYLKTKKIRRVVICSDNDTPGLNGARKLQERLSLPSCVWVPFFKDVREFVQRGGTATIVENSVADLIWKAA